MVLRLSPLSHVPLFATLWSPPCPPSQCEERGDRQETVKRHALAARHPSRGESGVWSAPRFQDIAAPLSPGLVSPPTEALPSHLRSGSEGAQAQQVPAARAIFCSVFTWSPAPSSASALRLASTIEGNRRRLNRTNEERACSPGSEASSSRTGDFSLC